MATKVKKRSTTIGSNSGGKFANLEKRIVSVDEVPIYLKVCAYGRTGTGKTHLLGTFPKPLLVLDFRDKGTKTIRSRDDTKVIQVTSWDDVEELYWYLVENPRGYKSVGWDTTTQAQDLVLSKIKGPRGGSTSRRVWGDVSELMKTWILNYRDLEMNVCFTAQDRISSTDDEDIDDEGELIPEVGPYVIPSVAKILNAAVDIEGNTYIREVEKTVKNRKTKKTKTIYVPQYCMRIGPHSRFITKIRKDPEVDGDIPRLIIDPSYDKLLKISIGEELNEDGDE